MLFTGGVEIPPMRAATSSNRDNQQQVTTGSKNECAIEERIAITGPGWWESVSFLQSVCWPERPCDRIQRSTTFGLSTSTDWLYNKHSTLGDRLHWSEVTASKKQGTSKRYKKYHEEKEGEEWMIPPLSLPLLSSNSKENNTSKSNVRPTFVKLPDFVVNSADNSFPCSELRRNTSHTNANAKS